MKQSKKQNKPLIKKKKNKLLPIVFGGFAIVLFGTIMMNGVVPEKVKKVSNDSAMTVGNFKEGKDFYILSNPIKDYVSSPTMEVTEFFWYGCPHCYTLEPYLNNWNQKNKNKNIEFERIHPAFSNSWVHHSKVFYSLKTIKKEKKYHDRIMKAIQENREFYSTANKISTLLDAEDRKSFISAYENVANDRLEEANMLSKKFGITGVPTIVIDGKYLTQAGMLDTYPEMMDLLTAFYNNHREIYKKDN